MAGEAVCLFDHHRLQLVVGAVDKHAAECADLPAVAGIDGGAQLEVVSREVGRRSHLADATTSGLGRGTDEFAELEQAHSQQKPADRDQGDVRMSKVRVVVGGRKGASISTSDGARKTREVDGP